MGNDCESNEFWDTYYKWKKLHGGIYVRLNSCLILLQKQLDDALYNYLQ